MHIVHVASTSDGPELWVLESGRLHFLCARLPTAMGSGAGFASVDGNLSQAEQSAGYGNRPLLAFNPTAVPRSEIVEATIWDNVYGWRRQELAGTPFTVRGPDGREVAAQTVETGS